MISPSAIKLSSSGRILVRRFTGATSGRIRPVRRHYGLRGSYVVDPANGSGSFSVSFVFPNDKYDVLATEPTWAHHRFIGWFDQAGTPDAAGTTIGNTISATDDALPERPEVYGQWQLPTTVVFDVVDGSMDPWSADYYEGQPFGELPVAVKEGLTFGGWYLDGTKVTSTSTVPAGGCTLVARFLEAQRVEYLESDGSGPYIDTGIVLQANDVVELTAQLVSSSGSFMALFGARKSSYQSNSYNMFTRFSNSNRFCYCRTGRETYSSSFSPMTKTDIVCSGLTATFSQNGSVVGTITSNGSLTDCVNHCLLFALNTAGAAAGVVPDSPNGRQRVWSFSVTRAGVKILDLVPVRVGTVGYMLDRVSGDRLGNVSSTGAFAYGNDVAEGGA